MNITVGTTSTAFSTSTAIGDSTSSSAPTMRMTSDRIQGMVTRWKNRRSVGEEEAEALRQHFAERQFHGRHDLAPLHFFAGAEFGGAERVGQPLRGAARPERLGLGLVRRPAVQEQHLEARRDPAGRQREALAVDLAPRAAAWRAARGRGGARPPGCSRPWRRGRASGRARLSYSTSIVSLSATGRAKPARCSRPAASRRSAKGETRGLRPPSISLSAAASAWRSCHSVAPPSMAPRSRPSGFRMRADLHQGAGQVVDPVQVHGAQHQVEALRREGQELLVGHDGRSAARSRAKPRPRSARTSQPTVVRSAKRRRDLVAVAAEIERHAERSGARRPAARPGGSRSRA